MAVMPVNKGFTWYDGKRKRPGTDVGASSRA